MGGCFNKMVMRKIAFIFPGQGSQNIGMGESLYDHFTVAREVFDTAEDILKWDVKGLCFENKGDKINLTEYTQPAILVTSISAWKILSAEGIIPGVVAGHSLGEYSAIVAAEGVSFIEMLPVVQTRGKLMQDAVPTGKGMMAALLGLSKETVLEICKSASIYGIVAPANYNAPDQVVIAGISDAVNKAMEIAKEKGVKRVVPLNVSVPSHSPLMKTASERLSEVLDAVKFSDLKTPLMTNVDARIVHSSSAIKNALVRQLTHPVRWDEAMSILIKEGFNTFVEVGPGRVLSGLQKRIARELNVEIDILNVEDGDSLNKVIETLIGSKGLKGNA